MTVVNPHWNLNGIQPGTFHVVQHPQFEEAWTIRGDVERYVTAPEQHPVRFHDQAAAQAAVDELNSWT